MIDRYQLRYFLAIVDHGNFSRAAAQCNVSQPTLSIGIAKLERQAGATLFRRTSQRVELTQAGALLLTYARRIEGDFNLAQQVLSGATSQLLMRLGILKSIPGEILARIAAELMRNDASAHVEFVEGSERELLGHVARGRVDCALTLVDRGSDRFLEEPLVEEGYALALSVDHPCADQATVPAEAVRDNVMIVRRHCEALSEISRHFTERGVRPHFAHRSTNDERVMQLVSTGLAITVMPDSYRAPDIVRPKLSGFNLRRVLGLMYGSAAEPLAAAPNALVAAVRQALSGGFHEA